MLFRSSSSVSEWNTLSHLRKVNRSNFLLDNACLDWKILFESATIVHTECWNWRVFFLKCNSERGNLQLQGNRGYKPTFFRAWTSNMLIIRIWIWWVSNIWSSMAPIHQNIATNGYWMSGISSISSTLPKFYKHHC